MVAQRGLPGLYLLFLVGLFVAFMELDLGAAWLAVMTVPFILAQALFVFGGGTTRLCDPIKPWRLWMPVVITAGMLVILWCGLFAAIAPLLDVAVPDWVEFHFWSLTLAIGIGFVGALWFDVRRRERIHALGHLATLLLVGSLAELLIAVPSYLIVSRSPAYPGTLTFNGIIAGAYVMAFSLGPMTVMLSLHPCYRRERRMRPTCCPACGYDLRGTLAANIRTCPECGAMAPENAIALPIE